MPPLFDYECRGCKKVFESLEFSSTQYIPCPECQCVAEKKEVALIAKNKYNWNKWNINGGNLKDN